jgi:hypothetical protein
LEAVQVIQNSDIEREQDIVADIDLAGRTND